MDGLLSQEEINALLNGMGGSGTTTSEQTEYLTDEQKDAVGEVSNISMGTAATTLFSLVNQKVVITTPNVDYSNWEDLVKEYDRPCVFIQIFYKEGLDGNNILILKERDVKIITDLMMGGDGTNTDAELTELHLSAISEAMNQMMGSAATSMSSMLSKKIDISPPLASVVNLNENINASEIAQFLSDTFVKVSFKMEIGDLVNSEIMQLYPIDFAKSLYSMFTNVKEEKKQEEVKVTVKPEVKAPEAPPTPQPQILQQPTQPLYNQPTYEHPMQDQFMYNQQPNTYMQMPPQNNMMPNYNQPYRDINVNAQPAQFQALSMGNLVHQKENIDLIMDVPLEVTVELGRTSKSIKDILELSPGTIIELDKLAGEPIDILVNNKLVAKGEVVVIDENFAIRITEIIKFKS